MPREKQNMSAVAAKDDAGPRPAALSPSAEGDAPEIAPRLKQPVPDPVRLFSSWCKGCGICVAFCPTKTLGISPITGKCIILLPEACTKCGLCELRCPDFAVTVIVNEHPHPGDKNA